MVKTTSFKNYCTCGGYAWQMNGRNPEQPHMDYCPQREEYAKWRAQQNVASGVNACCGRTMVVGYRCEGCPHAKAGDKLVPRVHEDPNPPPEGIDGVGADAPAQPTPYGLAGIEGDSIVIRLTADACAFAFANDPQARELRPPVINKQQFLRDTLNELTAEREDGSTPLTDMLDRAMVKAMENGSDALGHDAASGVTAAPAPHYWCNKCGYSGPVQIGHQRPNGSGECNYIAALVKPTDGVKGTSNDQPKEPK